MQGLKNRYCPIFLKKEDIGMNKSYHDKVQQTELCKKYLSGNQSRKEFCGVHKITPKTLSRWLCKNKTEKTGIKFLELSHVNSDSKLNAEMLLPNGIKIRIHGNQEDIIQLIMSLQRCN